MSQVSIEQELMYLRDMVSLAKEGRCMACGWPLAESAEKGCIPNNCCFRPSEHSVEYEPWFNRQQLLHRDSAHLAAVESQAGQADAPKFLTDAEKEAIVERLVSYSHQISIAKLEVAKWWYDRITDFEIPKDLDDWLKESLRLMQQEVNLNASQPAAQKGQGDAPSYGEVSEHAKQVAADLVRDSVECDPAKTSCQPAEQRGALSEHDAELWDLLFPEGTHTKQLPVDWGRWLDAYTEETYTLLLKAERDQIVQLEQWKRDAEIGMGALRAEIAQLTRERDEYKASYYTAHKNLCTTTSERDEAKQSR